MDMEGGRRERETEKSDLDRGRERPLAEALIVVLSVSLVVVRVMMSASFGLIVGGETVRMLGGIATVSKLSGQKVMVLAFGGY